MTQSQLAFIEAVTGKAGDDAISQLKKACLTYFVDYDKLLETINEVDTSNPEAYKAAFL